MIVEKSHNLLDQELEGLLELEKQARQDNNMDLSVKTCKTIIEMLWDSRDVEKLLATLKTLSSKRGQLMKSIIEMVKLCMSYIPSITPEERKIEFVVGIKQVCEKKIYLEVEYARCCMILVKHNEENAANLTEAVKIMENVQVETYGSMSKKEKMEFILYQMKINLLLKDYTKLYIVSKKVNLKILDEPNFEHEKITFNLYSFFFFQHDGDYVNCTNCLKQAYNAFRGLNYHIDPSQVDPLVLTQFNHLLEKSRLAEAVLTFKCLEPFKLTKQEELSHLIKELEVYVIDNHTLNKMLDAFTTHELSSCNVDNYNVSKLLVFNESFLNNKKFLTQFEIQIVKKNLFMVSKYYKQVRIQKLSVLLENSPQFIEDQLCDLVVDGFVVGKIDRMDMVVRFDVAKDDMSVLDNWVDNINGVLDLVHFVCERIEREEIAL